MNKFKHLNEDNEEDYNKLFGINLRTTYLDRVYAFELRLLIGQIPELEEVSKNKIHNLQLVLCEMKETNFLGDKFIERYI